MISAKPQRTSYPQFYAKSATGILLARRAGLCCFNSRLLSELGNDPRHIVIIVDARHQIQTNGSPFNVVKAWSCQTAPVSVSRRYVFRSVNGLITIW